MRDEDFGVFVDEFGEADQRAQVPAAAIDRWRDKLPDRLLQYWQDEGWASYGDGLIWLVDPDEYEDLVDEWLEGSPLESLDAFHVMARTAFGDLFLWGEQTGRSVTVCSALNLLVARKDRLTKKSPKELDRSVRAFFGLGRGDCDFRDAAGQMLFGRARTRLGLLAVDEVYGFEPALVLGGKASIDSLRKVKIDPYLTLLRQLAKPAGPF